MGLDDFKKTFDAIRDHSKEKKLKVGIIGTGWIAGNHAESYKQLEDVEVVACADLVPGKAEAFCKERMHLQPHACPVQH